MVVSTGQRTADANNRMRFQTGAAATARSSGRTVETIPRGANRVVMRRQAELTMMERINDLPHQDRDEVLRAVGCGRAVRDPRLAVFAVPYARQCQRWGGTGFYRQPLYVGVAIVMTVLVALTAPWWAAALAIVAFTLTPLATQGRVTAAIEAERANRLLLS